MHDRRFRHTRGRPAVVEAVEGRTLLSGGGAAVPHPAKLKLPRLPGRFAHARSTPTAIEQGGPWATPPIQPLVGPNPPFTPAQIRRFYGVDTLSAAGTGDGAGQTVAIVDAYYSANVVSDLNTFAGQYGLSTTSAGTFTFAAVNESGGTTLPTATNSGWREETALDVEWVHSIAPRANILLVECNSNSNADIYAGINYARSAPGVSVVSMSFGSPDAAGESSADAYFTTPAGHAGVTFVASTGDDGAGQTVYPSLSPNVVAVGGTTIALGSSAGAYSSETAWSGGGGAVSPNEPTPAYQGAAGADLGYANRAAPDVSFEADANTGVSTYDSLDGGYFQTGGTSLSAPCWAALIAIADQQRAAAGAGTYDGATQTLPRLYAIYGSPTYAVDFHDVTTGSNGNAADIGYDLSTGLGTPVASQLVPDLANVAPPVAVAGQVFQDNNANNVVDGADAPVAGAVVYLDANNDGVREPTEPTATTSSTGTYAFASLVAGSAGTVRVLSSPLAGGVVVAAPAYTVPSAGTATANVGLFPTVYADAKNADVWVVRNAPTSSATLQVLVNGVVTYTAPNTLVPSLTFNFTGAGVGLTVNATNGSPLPVGGLTLNGAAGGNDTLRVLGTSGNDSFVATAGQVLFAAAGGAARPITFANVSAVTIDPRAGTDAINVSAGTVTIPAGTGGALLSRAFSTVAIAAGATLRVAPGVTHAGRAVLTAAAGGLVVAPGGTLDLGDNDLVVRSGSAAAVDALLGAGGIVSSVAAGPAHLTTLGAAAAGDLAVATFDAVPVAAADVIVKFTYFGDANLDGVVDGRDYVRVDAGAAAAGASAPLTGWSNGDFNGDGRIDGSDYTLIDNAFDTQAAGL